MTQALKPQPVTDVFAECKSKVTRKQYPPTLNRFFDYLGLPGNDVDSQGLAFLEQARLNELYANDKIREYILKNRERVEAGEITAGTLKGMFTPIKIFVDGFDDVTAKVNWKRIKKLIPTIRSYADDRAPTKEEIQKTCEFPDRRIKAIVYTMASSGIRIGAWENMKVKHIKPITNDKTGEVIAAQLQVYGREAGNYKTFMTAEAYNEIKKWLDFRAMYGEQITPESLVMRNIWRTSDVKRRTTNDKRGGAIGLAKEPKKLKVNALARLLVRALYEQGLRESLGEGEKRHEWKGAHGYRKWFKTTAEYAGMKSLYVEFLMGHSIGLSASYLRIPEEDLLSEYLKIAPALTFNENIQTLKQQQEQLEQKQTEKDQQIERMQKQIEELMSAQKEMRNMFAHSASTMSSLVEMVRAGSSGSSSIDTDKKKKKSKNRDPAIVNDYGVWASDELEQLRESMGLSEDQFEKRLAQLNKQELARLAERKKQQQQQDRQKEEQQQQEELAK